MVIHLIEKEVYGNRLFYVEHEVMAAPIKALTGKKTVDFSDVQALESLGLDVVLKSNPGVKASQAMKGKR